MLEPEPVGTIGAIEATFADDSIEAEVGAIEAVVRAIEAEARVIDLDDANAPHPPDVPDAVLARRASMGDRSAFAIIFDRHAGAMFRYAVHMLDGDAHAAEDAVQDALAKAWQHLATFRGEAELRTWLFQITAHEVLNARRRRRPVPVDDQLLATLPADSRAQPGEVVAGAEMWDALSDALSELPWRQRASWLLREMEELSYEEIATILQTSPTVVRGQLHRARGTLAVRMVQWR